MLIRRKVLRHLLRRGLWNPLEVAQSTAQQMAQDFTAYQHEPSANDEKKLYKYRPSGQREPSGDEVFVALDFGEIVALEVDRRRKVSARESSLTSV